jgi:poly(3-hydroxybutyrate) depolymerase
VFPEKYDGETPLPVLFGFHGCGSYNFGDANRTEFWDVTRNSGFETDYVVAIPLAASGNCFDYDTDIVRAKALYDDLVENYCVDLDRVFGTGHSSGAGFLVSILASNHQADFEHFNFRGIAPVSAWLIGGHATEVPTMYIESVDDTERGEGNAQAVVDKFIDVNACATTSTPYAVDACNSSHDGDPVNAGCRSYDACSAVTIWCSHDDSAYSGTFHGIPCFYRQAVYDFFEGL